MTIDATIQRLTGDGEIIAQFLVDTLQGYTRDATVSHRLKSAEWLTAFGRLIPEHAIPKSASVRPRPKSEPKRDKLDKKPKVTEKQILHFDIARLIKQETNDGETIIEFLIRVISKIEETGENFTPAVRMRAARELLIRGFGGTIPGVRRILSGKTEELDSYLSKIVREYTNYGADSIRFLVETMENKDPEADSRGAASFINLMRMRPRTKPAEGFTASHRVWAACELLRRAYDIKTDHITYEDIQAYWSAQTPVASAASAANSEKRPAAVNEKTDHDKQPAVAKNIAAKEKPDADNTPSDTPDRAARRRQKRDARKAQKRAVSEQPAAATANITAAEKPAIITQKRDDHKQRDDAEKPAADPDGAPASETRAARRRQKRAARKAQKRAVQKRAANTPTRSVYPEDIANIEAYKQRLQARSDAIRDAKLRNADIRKIPELKRHITPEEVAAFQRQPGNLYNRTREMYKEKYGEYPFPDDIPANARSP